MATIKDLVIKIANKTSQYSNLNELIGANSVKIASNVSRLENVDDQISQLSTIIGNINSIKSYSGVEPLSVNDIVEHDGIFKVIKEVPENSNIEVANAEYFTQLNGLRNLDDLTAVITELNRIMSITDQIGFDTVTLGENTYPLVVKKADPSDPYPNGKPKNSASFAVEEHNSDATSEAFEGTLNTTLYHSGEYTPKVEEESFTESVENLETVSGYKVFKFTKMNSEPEVQNNTNGKVIKTTSDYVILSPETNSGDITVTGEVTTKVFEPETVTETAETVLTFDNAYEEEPQYDVAGTGVTVEPLQNEAPYTSAKVSKDITAEVEYGSPVTVSEDFKVNVNRTQITYTYDDGTTEVIDHHNDEPVTLTMDDGSTDTTTVGELAKAFENGQ